MPTIRLHHADKFCVVSNEAAQDDHLSLASRGLLLLMLSMPDDWRFNLVDLTNRHPGGRDATRTALKLLEKRGYIRWEQDRNEGGNFNGNVLFVYETPRLNPKFINSKKKSHLTAVGKPVSGKTDCG